MTETISAPVAAKQAAAPARRWRLDLALAGLAFVISLLAYVSTMRRTFGWGDTSELMIAAYYLGIGHSPGYPTWMLLMYPFAHLPFGSVALRVNFANAFFGALAVAGLFWVFLTATRHRVAAFVAALSLGFALTFWDITTETDVFTVHVTLMAAILLVLLWWRRERRDRQLYLLAWLVGISLGNHALTALLIPALLYLVWAEEGRGFFTWRRLLLVSAFTLLGFAIYAYLPLRGMADPPPHANNATWYYHMSAPGARNAMFSKSPLVMLHKAGLYARFLWSHEFGTLGALLGLLGIGYLWRRDRRLLGFIAVAVLVDVAYACNFSVFDVYTYYLPTHIMWAFLLAFGAAHASEWTGRHIVAREKTSLSPLRQYGAISIILLLTPLLLFSYHRTNVGSRGDVDPEHFARAAMEMVAPNALIIGDWWHIAPMAYLKYLEGVRADVHLNSAASLESLEQFAPYANPASIRKLPPVYFTELLTNRGADFRENGCYLVPAGPLWRIYADRPPAKEVLAPTPKSRPLASFGDEVALARAEVPSTVFDPAAVFRMTLYWTKLPKSTKRYAQVTVVIQNEQEEPVFWQTTPLGHDLYPQGRLQPGQTVREPHSIYLGEPLPPGKYHLLVRVKGRRGTPFACDHPASDKEEWSYEVAGLTVREEQEGEGS